MHGHQVIYTRCRNTDEQERGFWLLCLLDLLKFRRFGVAFRSLDFRLAPSCTGWECLGPFGDPVPGIICHFLSIEVLSIYICAGCTARGFFDSSNLVLSIGWVSVSASRVQVYTAGKCRHAFICHTDIVHSDTERNCQCHTMSQ